MERDAYAWAAARDIGTATRALVERLSAANSAGEAAAVLRDALAWFSHPPPEESETISVSDAREVPAWPAALRRHAALLGWPQLQRLWLEDQFPAWATAVLTVAAGEWLGGKPGSAPLRELEQLVQDTFTLSPAAAALAALVEHLSAVLPRRGSGGVAVTALAADAAAELLAARFAEHGSSGLQQLLASCDARHGWGRHGKREAAHAANAGSDAAACCLPALAPEAVLAAAQQLAAVPDRARQLGEGSPCSLHPDVFVRHVLQEVTRYLADAGGTLRSFEPGTWKQQQQQQGETQQPMSIAADAVSGAVTLSVALVTKLVTRGHAAHVAAALLDLAAGGSGESADSGGSSGGGDVTAAACWLLSGVSRHSAAAERLLLQLLQQAAAAAALGGAASDDATALTCLRRLLSSSLVTDAGLRRLACTRLLQARTLPERPLQLLLQLLAHCTPNLLPAAAASLAECWSDSSTMLHVPVCQQAYMTHALVCCLRALPRAAVDPSAPPPQQSSSSSSSNGDDNRNNASSRPAAEEEDDTVVTRASMTLVSSLLQGVSRRLASPSPSIRAQAMRVGRAYAAKLDPAKPLFADAGALQLLPDECWPGCQMHDDGGRVGSDWAAESAAAAEPHVTPHQQQQQQLVVVEEEEEAPPEQQAGSADDADDDGAVGAGSFAALDRLQQVTLEPDSDDEEDMPPPVAPPLQPLQQPAPGRDNRLPSAATAVGRDDDQHPGDDDDDDFGSEGSAGSLVAYDLQEDLDAEQWWGSDGMGLPDGKPTTLRAVAAALRKQDDVNAALDALARVEVLVRAQPDELAVVAPELARALLHCRVPVWAGTPTPLQAAAASQQPPRPAPPRSGAAAGAGAAAQERASDAEVQRQRGLVAVLSLSPLTAGDTAVAELYSPHLDQYQRTLVLDCLCAAAAEMSDPRRAPQLSLSAPGTLPQLLPPTAGRSRGGGHASAVLQQGSQSAAALLPQQQQQQQQESKEEQENAEQLGNHRHQEQQQQQQQDAQPPRTVAPGMVEASRRVWGHAALAKQQRDAAAAAAAAAAISGNRPGETNAQLWGSRPGAGSSRTFRNRFAPVAVRWASLLLQQADVKQHGVDLFGRDSHMLGRLLMTLGCFVECAAATPAAVPLAVGLLDLLCAKEVSGHDEVHVRRCALVAASQVLRHLPPARLAGAMLQDGAGDVQETLLVERLQWLLGWAQLEAGQDVDEHCRLLASGCISWHAELTRGAMAALELLPAPPPPGLASSGGRRSGRSNGGIDVRLPSLRERLVLQ